MEVRHTVGKQLHDTKVGGELWRKNEEAQSTNKSIPKGKEEKKERPEPSGWLSSDYQRWLSGKEKRIISLEKYLLPQSL